MTLQLSMFGEQYDGKQGDLLAGSFTVPTSKPLSDVPQIFTQAAPVPPSRHDLPLTATHLATTTIPVVTESPSASACPECGDPVPVKAKACPNCYTRIKPKGGK